MLQFLKNRRKRYLINPRFQLRFIIYICAFSALGITFFYFANLYFFYRLEWEGVSLGLPKEHIYFQFIEEQKLILHLIFLFTSVVVFVGISLSGLFLSHKIAGPLYHFCIHTRRLRRGDKVGPLKFRQNDFFIEVANDFNLSVDYLRQNPTAHLELSSDEAPEIPQVEEFKKAIKR